MARQKILENVLIEDISHDGKGVGKQSGRVVFVEQSVPGDVVDIRLTGRKKSVWQGRISRMVKASDLRTQPFCSHFGECGGCKWQHLTYDRQLFFKQKTVSEALKRIGKLELPEIRPIIGGAQDRYYRNKLEFTFSSKKWLTREQIDSGEDLGSRYGVGFHKAGHFDKVLDIETCYLQAEPSNSIRNFIKAYTLEHEYSYFDLVAQQGFLRNLIIRTTTTGEVMVILSFFHDDKPAIKSLLDALAAKFPEITSLIYVINGKKNDTISDLPMICHSGKPYITEQLGHVKFRIGPVSFFQTNTAQALNLYETVQAFAGLNGTETVYDLYTGIGSIALYLAKDCQRIIGIEQVAAAIDDARENARLNQISNADFLTGDMKTVFTPSVVRKYGIPDVIITDPPRAGMHSAVIEQLNRIRAKKIIYVSCNPATQARDLQMLGQHYTIEAIQPVDMFPHTAHIENVVSLTLTHPEEDVNGR